jgi:hypothetical protein
MPFIRRFAVGAAVALMLAVPPALAAETAPSPHALELTKRYFAAILMERSVESMMRTMMPALTQQMVKANPNLTPQDQQAITEAAAESSREMAGKLTDRMAPLFASSLSERELEGLAAFHEGPTGQAVMAKMATFTATTAPRPTDFSQQELEGLVAFYEGPTGQAMMAKMPALMAELAPSMAELTLELTADLRKRICARVDCSKINPPEPPAR